jgi:hypothetical protein
LIPLLQQTSNYTQVYWLAACFELKLDIAKALDAQQSQEAIIDTLKPSKMNRLQRSLVSSRVPAVAKDSTVRISEFLKSTLKAIAMYLQNHVQANEDWKVSL